MKLESKVNWVGMVVFLLMVMSMPVMAEQIQKGAKDNIDVIVYESDEIEWRVVWQDEIRTAEVVYGEPKAIWIVIGAAFWAWTAYDVYINARDGDYVAAIVSVTPAGKVSKVAKVLKKNTIIHRHHLLPRQFEWYFRSKGINIDDCIMKLPVEKHREIHTIIGGNWNARWWKFISERPDAEKPEIYDEMWRLIDDFKLKGYKIKGRCR